MVVPSDENLSAPGRPEGGLDSGARIRHPLFVPGIVPKLGAAVLARRRGPAVTVAANPYLEGNFAPVLEEVTATELPVTGHVPEALCGRYLRNGPNPVSPPEPSTYHWFTGDGMVHGIRLRDGRAEWYRNRWVRSAEVARALGEEPRPGPVHAGMDFCAQHQRHRPRGPHLRHRRGGAAPVRADDELETIGAVRLRRHARRRLHGAPEAGPADGRALRRVLLLRVGRRRRGDHHRRGRAGCVRPGGSPWAARSACTTAPSPNAPSSCSTSR